MFIRRKNAILGLCGGLTIFFLGTLVGYESNHKKIDWHTHTPTEVRMRLDWEGMNGDYVEFVFTDPESIKNLIMTPIRNSSVDTSSPDWRAGSGIGIYARFEQEHELVEIGTGLQALAEVKATLDQRTYWPEFDELRDKISRMLVDARDHFQFKIPLTETSFYRVAQLSDRSRLEYCPVSSSNWALCIGATPHNRRFKPGKFAHLHQRKLYDALLRSEFSKNQMALLHDENLDYFKLPTVANIERRLDDLARLVKPDDNILISIGGACVQEGNVTYLELLSPRYTDSERERLSLSSLFERLDRITAKNKLVIIAPFRDRDPGEYDVADDPRFTKLDEFPSTIKVPASITLLAPRKCAQTVEEGDWFAELTRGLSGDADVDGNYRVTLDELLQFVNKKAPEARVERMGTREFTQEFFLRLLEPGRPLKEQQPMQPGKIAENSIGMKLVEVPPGHFLMGNDGSDPHPNFTELPRHRVWITRSFAIGQTEVTQEQWTRVMGTSPWKLENDPGSNAMCPDGPNYPAVNVNYDEVIEFCDRLSKKEGATYRLPTEAEWEYACRAGTTTPYYFGSDASRISEFAWYDTGDGGEKASKCVHEVGLKLPNPLGLYDMLGNAGERCGDRYRPTYYLNSPAEDPFCIEKRIWEDPAAGRVIRLASVISTANRCTASARAGWFENVHRMPWLGFRVVREN